VRIVIGPIFVELQSKTRQFPVKYGVIPSDSSNIGPITIITVGGERVAKLAKFTY
jgi:hypothetical protein